jgi:hypothetical protein
MKLTGENRSVRGKTCPNATLSTKNPTWTEPESNPGFRGVNSLYYLYQYFANKTAHCSKN